MLYKYSEDKKESTVSVKSNLKNVLFKSWNVLMGLVLVIGVLLITLLSSIDVAINFTIFEIFNLFLNILYSFVVQCPPTIWSIVILVITLSFSFGYR